MAARVELLEEGVGGGGVGVEERLQPGEALAAALDRVARHREGAAHEADERDPPGERLPGWPGCPRPT